MKKALTISDPTLKAIKREALRRGVTMTELVESALRKTLEPPGKPARLTPLPVAHLGRARVVVSDRSALHDLLDD